MHNQPSHFRSINVVNFRKASSQEGRRVAFILSWYDKKTNQLEGEENIQGLNLDTLLKIFNAPFWNQNFQCWSVEAQHIEALQPYISHIIDNSRYSYFIEAYNME